jgi:hypothetical protein
MKAGQFSDACELLEAEGQSYYALKRATGWRGWRNFNLPDAPPASYISAMPERVQQGRKYSALQTLAGWYVALAVLSGIGAGIGCLLGIVVATRDGTVGSTMIITFLIAGAISVVALLAFAEGIRLAIDIATDLKEIRDQLSTASAKQSADADRSSE